MAEEEKDEVLDKKTAKAQEKAARAEAKAQKKADRKKAKELNDDLDMDDETSTGGKIAVFFVTLIIILIWLAIIVLLIKCDVGGFGSSVLAPVLKDVPYVNKILPDSATEEVSTEDDAYGYTSIDDAVARIKELEKELADARNISHSLRASPQNWHSTSRTRRILRLRSKSSIRRLCFQIQHPI